MPDIQYLGRACVRIRGREGIVVSDPFPKADGFDAGRPTAHIVTLSGADGRRLSATHELGLKEWEALDKVTVTRASLPGEDDETRVVVLKPAAVNG